MGASRLIVQSSTYTHVLHRVTVDRDWEQIGRSKNPGNLECRRDRDTQLRPFARWLLAGLIDCREIATARLDGKKGSITYA